MFAFYTRKGARKNHIIQPCKECHKSVNANNAKTKRLSHLKRTYNLSKEEYEALLKDQNNACAICSRELLVVNVDHCHETNKIRGLLCPECNRGLGLFYDNAERLTLAARYIENAKHK